MTTVFSLTFPSSIADLDSGNGFSAQECTFQQILIFYLLLDIPCVKVVAKYSSLPQCTTWRSPFIPFLSPSRRTIIPLTVSTRNLVHKKLLPTVYKNIIYHLLSANPRPPENKMVGKSSLTNQQETLKRKYFSFAFRQQPAARKLCSTKWTQQAWLYGSRCHASSSGSTIPMKRIAVSWYFILWPRQWLVSAALSAYFHTHDVYLMSLGLFAIQKRPYVTRIQRQLKPCFDHQLLTFSLNALQAFTPWLKPLPRDEILVFLAQLWSPIHIHQWASQFNTIQNILNGDWLWINSVHRLRVNVMISVFCIFFVKTFLNSRSKSRRLLMDSFMPEFYYRMQYASKRAGDMLFLLSCLDGSLKKTRWRADKKI